jgi:hypothetical protein
MLRLHQDKGRAMGVYVINLVCRQFFFSDPISNPTAHLDVTNLIHKGIFSQRHYIVQLLIGAMWKTHKYQLSVQNLIVFTSLPCSPSLLWCPCALFSSIHSFPFSDTSFRMRYRIPIPSLSYDRLKSTSSVRPSLTPSAQLQSSLLSSSLSATKL